MPPYCISGCHPHTHHFSSFFSPIISVAHCRVGGRPQPRGGVGRDQATPSVECNSGSDRFGYRINVSIIFFSSVYMCIIVPLSPTFLFLINDWSVLFFSNQNPPPPDVATPGVRCERMGSLQGVLAHSSCHPPRMFQGLHYHSLW